MKLWGDGFTLSPSQVLLSPLGISQDRPLPYYWEQDRRDAYPTRVRINIVSLFSFWYIGGRRSYTFPSALCENLVIIGGGKPMKVIFHPRFYEVYTGDPAAAPGRMEAIVRNWKEHLSLLSLNPLQRGTLKGSMDEATSNP